MFKTCLKGFCEMKKKVFVTTPIFYVNSKPHIGHLYSAILAAAVKQVHLLNTVKDQNENISQLCDYPILSTGTDEHGLKIQHKAKESKMEPKAFCDSNSKLFKDLFDNSKIDYDCFIRTTDQAHIDYVTKFWNQMKVKRMITKCDYSGFYSVQDESFVPEKDLVKKGDKYFTNLSLLANQPVEYVTEQNFQIKFSVEVIEEYLKIIESEKLKFIPASIKNEVRGYIKQNLLQLCVTRPSERVSWGIPVPEDENHVIYVWFEALLNYLTVAEKHFNGEIDLDKLEFIHIIGKDISKFHCYIWPLILLLNKSFPFKITILMHNYWLKNETKMSKSIGNVVDPETLIKKFGIDAVRFYFLAAGPQVHDVSFDEKTLTNVFYKNIPDSFINLILRLSNNKIIDINKYNKIERFSEVYKKKITENMKHVENAKKELLEYNFIAAAHYIHLLLLDMNNLIQTSEFWKKTEDYEMINNIACFCFEFIRIIAALYTPFLPELMSNVNKFIGTREEFVKLKFCYFRQELDDKHIENFNKLIKDEGYFKTNMEFKEKIFVNKIKL